MKASYLNLHDLVWAIACVQCILLVVILIVLPAQRAQSRTLLSLFLLEIAGILGTYIFIWNLPPDAAGANGSLLAPVILSICILLQGPTLYFYLRSLTENIDLLQWRRIWHLVPAVVVSSVIVAFDIRSDVFFPWLELPAVKVVVVTFVWAMLRCFPLFYVGACCVTEYRVRRAIKQRYSSFSRRDLNLMYLILGGYSIRWLWSFVGYFIGDHISADTNHMMIIVDNYLSVLLVNILFFFGLFNSRQVMGSAKHDPIADARRLLEIAHVTDKIQAVERGISKKKLYLDSHINIDRFAEQVGIRSRELSEILNSHFHQNFFEFINAYRVEEAKRLLSEPTSQESILDIVYKSGFNSQSAFHRFFKRMVGMTPSEYRKKSIVQDRLIKSGYQSSDVEKINAD